jgi:predicted lipase
MINASTFELEMHAKLRDAGNIRDICIVESSKGTFAIAIDKGFIIITLDIEKHLMRKSPAFMTDHALSCLAAVSARVIATCSYRPKGIKLYDMELKQVVKTIKIP